MIIYFVDAVLPDGTEKPGSIGGPKESALAYAEELRQEHPEWQVEVNPVDTANG